MTLVYFLLYFLFLAEPVFYFHRFGFWQLGFVVRETRSVVRLVVSTGRLYTWVPRTRRQTSPDDDRQFEVEADSR